jgi:uncharacterized protein YbcC (UPF0753/DUF2309 family)
MKTSYLKNIATASEVVGKTWPLYSFVTSNPLSGYEQSEFKDAIENAERLFGTKMYPNATQFRQAWEHGEIDKNELVTLLSENGFMESPEFYLDQLETIKTTSVLNVNHDLDRIMVKWLSVFMDEGLAEWQMPNKSKGFYKAWRSLAIYDDEIGNKSSIKIPKDSTEALEYVLSEYSEEDQLKIFKYHLASLPGWSGYIKYRNENNTLWQQKYKITLEDYLAARLWTAKHINAEILPKTIEHKYEDAQDNLPYIWLKAWEKSWQNEMINGLQAQINDANSQSEVGVADAQMVFCIDTRSELIRRNVESKGDYETFGYAGFFGIAMDYKNLDDGLTRKSCPPIVPSAYNVVEAPQENKVQELKAYRKRNKTVKFQNYFLKRMKNMLPSAFGYVEGSGLFYGVSLVSRTLIPGLLYNSKRKNEVSHEDCCEPKLNDAQSHEPLDSNIPLEEKIAIVKSAFDLTGWTQFSPLVLFVGHGTHTANNPFGSSLDCGACAASPGRHNARMLATLANLPEVRNGLKGKYNVEIPEDTIFIGAEHNTTTDEIKVFDSQVPDSHRERLHKLKMDLKRAQETATAERLGTSKDSVAAANIKTNNWSETRPEWGLAKNAGFVIAPRTLTKDINLNSRCFLHSYDWQTDKDGAALQGIMQGPMVVTQWINNHYYFSTVDNENFGGGSKITHNITGKFGVVQGNGGDLKVGLPLQSVNEADDKMYHRPLRLSVLIQAPRERITEILLNNPSLKSLLDNEWIYLLVMDPTNNNEVERYCKNMIWTSEKLENAGKAYANA